MTRASSRTELTGFLAQHELVAQPKLYDVGSVLGAWRVTTFLGSGGNAEVYRVIRDEDGLAAAAKVLLRDDESSKKRFRQEVALLSAQRSPHFAKFYASGEADGRLYMVSELLEPIDLPENEREIADYLLKICEAVDVLHRSGLIHRDIKPSNIMRRANGELVLIDLGLVKDTVKSSEPEQDLSIVSGKAIAVGTPRFAAPEQMMGGEVTVAADVHAIGRLADVAFGSNPPRSWLPVIRRATSSIPDQRYPSVDALAFAIRHRNDARSALLVAATLGSAVLTVGAALGLWRTTVKPKLAWRSLCENATTNLVVRELAWERLVTNQVGHSTTVIPERAYREVQRQTDVTVVRLNGQTNEFDRPIALDASREYFIEGPGILAADIQAEDGNVRVHLKNCFLFNRSALPLDKAGIHYVFEGGAYLNFTEQDELPRSAINGHIDGFDGAYDEIRWRGPTSKQGLERIRAEENRAILNRDARTISKNLHFPRHFFASRGKYLVDDMEDSIYEKYGINPNRVPTDAEVESVAYYFDVSESEAASILSSRTNPSEFGECERSKGKGAVEG